MALNRVPFFSKKYSIKTYFAAVLIFTVVPAFYVWHSSLFPVCCVLLPLVVLSDVLIHGFNTKSVIAVFCLIMMQIWYIIAGDLTIFGAILVLSITPCLLVKKDFLIQVYNAFLQVFAVLMSLSILSYILVILLGVDLPHAVIEPLNQSKTETYYLYPFLITTNSLLAPLEFRFMGFFDEPGMLGTLCSILLLSDKFNMKKKENIIILISGILSMSFFFYIICLFYVLIKVPVKYKIGLSLVILILVILLIDNEVLNELVFSRFLFEDGSISGLNRDTGGFDDYFRNFRHTSAYWTGLGPGVGDQLNEGGSSYKQVIVNYGVIFFVLYCGCFYLHSLRILKKGFRILIFSILFLGVMFQRPFVGDTALSFFMFVLPSVIEENYKQK